MTALSSDLKNAGYQCGRLLAVYEDLQHRVSGKNDMLSRYYSGCSQRPAFVLGRLQQLASYYMGKLKSSWYKEYYNGLLSDIYQEIQGDVPKMLSVSDQAYFAVGYWKQVAAMRREEAQHSENGKKSGSDANSDANVEVN